MDYRIKMHDDLCHSIHEMFVKKNMDYGNAYAKFRAKFPNAILMHLNEKLSRLDTLMTSGAKPNVSNESIEDTLLDIANYALMEVVERRIGAEKATTKRATPITGAAKKPAPKTSDPEKSDDKDFAAELTRLLDELKRKEDDKKKVDEMPEDIEDLLGAILTLSILADTMRGD